MGPLGLPGGRCRPPARDAADSSGWWAARLCFCFPFNEQHQHIPSPHSHSRGDAGCRHLVFCMFPRWSTGRVLLFSIKKKKIFQTHTHFQESVAIKEVNVSHEKTPEPQGPDHEHGDTDEANSAKPHLPLPWTHTASEP